MFCLYFFYLWTGVGVYVGICVCIRTYAHTVHVAHSDVSSGAGTTHLNVISYVT